MFYARAISQERESLSQRLKKPKPLRLPAMCYDDATTKIKTNQKDELFNCNNKNCRSYTPLAWWKQCAEAHPLDHEACLKDYMIKTYMRTQKNWAKLMDEWRSLFGKVEDSSYQKKWPSALLTDLMALIEKCRHTLRYLSALLNCLKQQLVVMNEKHPVLWPLGRGYINVLFSWTWCSESRFSFIPIAI